MPFWRSKASSFRAMASCSCVAITRVKLSKNPGFWLMRVSGRSSTNDPVTLSLSSCQAHADPAPTPGCSQQIALSTRNVNSTWSFLLYSCCVALSRPSRGRDAVSFVPAEEDVRKKNSIYTRRARLLAANSSAQHPRSPTGWAKVMLFQTTGCDNGQQTS